MAQRLWRVDLPLEDQSGGREILRFEKAVCGNWNGDRGHSRTSVHMCPTGLTPNRSANRRSDSAARRSSLSSREEERSGDRAARRVTTRRSACTVDGDGERGAGLAQTQIGNASQPLDEDGGGHRLDRVEIDGASARDRLEPRFEDNFTGQTSDSGGARGDKCTTKAGYRRVTRQDENRSATDLGHLAPPELTPLGERTQEAAAAARNEARSPHSSGSWSGCSSYAA